VELGEVWPRRPQVRGVPSARTTESGCGRGCSPGADAAPPRPCPRSQGPCRTCPRSRGPCCTCPRSRGPCRTCPRSRGPCRTCPRSRGPFGPKDATAKAGCGPVSEGCDAFGVRKAMLRGRHWRRSWTSEGVPLRAFPASLAWWTRGSWRSCWRLLAAGSSAWRFPHVP
jgi:hypothetical protein